MSALMHKKPSPDGFGHINLYGGITDMQIGCALMGGTFMPEFKSGAHIVETPFERIFSGYRKAVGMGYDYVEASASELLALSKDELNALVEKKDKGEFALRYVNSFVRGDLKICVEKQETLEKYAREVIIRAHMLGAGVVVFGSGAARMRPDSMTHEQGIKKLSDFIVMCKNISKEYGIKISLEPLNAAETNIINKVSQGAELVRRLDSPEIVLLADAFHMAIEGESASVIIENEDIISHIHVSEAPGRVYPGRYGGEYLIKLGKELKESKFDKDITVECCFDDFEKEGIKALRFVKEKML